MYPSLSINVDVQDNGGGLGVTEHSRESAIYGHINKSVWSPLTGETPLQQAGGEKWVRYVQNNT